MSGGLAKRPRGQDAGEQDPAGRPVGLEGDQAIFRVVDIQGGDLPGELERHGGQVVVQAAGIDKRVPLHTVRHSFATHLFEQKVNRA